MKRKTIMILAMLLFVACSKKQEPEEITFVVVKQPIEVEYGIEIDLLKSDIILQTNGTVSLESRLDVFTFGESIVTYKVCSEKNASRCELYDVSFIVKLDQGNVPSGPKIYGAMSVSEEFESRMLSYPTTIYLFNDTETSIAFIYEYGLYTDEEKLVNSKKDKYGNPYLYYGNVTELADNVYSVRGESGALIETYKDYISENIDFYIVLRGKKLFVVFEEMPLEDLINYNSEYYGYLEK